MEKLNLEELEQKASVELPQAYQKFVNSQLGRIRRIIAAFVSITPGSIPFDCDPPLRDWERKISLRIRESGLSALPPISSSDASMGGAIIGFFFGNETILKHPTDLTNDPTIKAVFELRDAFKDFVPHLAAVFLSGSPQEVREFTVSLNLAATFEFENGWIQALLTPKNSTGIVLLVLSDEVSKCTSTTEAYEMLVARGVPANFLGTLERFQRLCREFGMQLGNRGGSRRTKKKQARIGSA